MIVGFNVSACILCVRDMYASLDHHMICCPDGRKSMRCHQFTFKARDGQVEAGLYSTVVHVYCEGHVLVEAKDFKKAVEIFTNRVSVVA